MHAPAPAAVRLVVSDLCWATPAAAVHPKLVALVGLVLVAVIVFFESLFLPLAVVAI